MLPLIAALWPAQAVPFCSVRLTYPNKTKHAALFTFGRAQTHEKRGALASTTLSPARRTFMSL